MQFEALPLKKEVLDGVKTAGFVECTKVQEKVLPISLSGRDVMVQSKTGSGKTAVFLLTILNRYLENNGALKALILSPTRELASQIYEDGKVLSKYIPSFKSAVFYGGVGYKMQEEALSKKLDLYVGTPGRLMDYARNHKIDFREFDIVVLDEADRMFDMGFYPDIQKMFSSLREKEKRQTMLFSATLSTSVRNLAWRDMNEPKEIEVEKEEIVVKKIDQRLYHVSKDEKFKLLIALLKKEKPESTLIFTNTKDKAVEVSERLNLSGFKSEYLMGDMNQSLRLRTLSKMKEKKTKILVATDVAARGLQIDELSLVVNYDIPEDFENYVHRIGRTARAGKSGKAITLADEEYIYGLEAIENYIQMKIPVHWADEDELEEVEDNSLALYKKALREGTINKEKNINCNSSKPKMNQNKKREKKKGKRAQQENKVVKEINGKKESSNYDALSALTVEERLEYYRSKYFSSQNSESEKRIEKKENEENKQKNKEEKEQKEVKSEKKKGLFSFIFRRRK